jgi:hypothetical protein
MTIAVQASHHIARDLENFRETAETISSVLQIALALIPASMTTDEGRRLVSMALARTDDLVCEIVETRRPRLALRA